MTVEDLEPLYYAWQSLEQRGWQRYAETIGEIYDTLRETIIFHEGEYVVAHVPAR